VQLKQAPRRIVSLNPTSTEVLFAIGAGDQVVAVELGGLAGCRLATLSGGERQRAVPARALAQQAAVPPRRPDRDR
jgi:ABC-type Mn2+/Zn2+ transport system ATPase subunit